ncbi:MAG: hypothetical protein HFJ58_04780 [Clostridia bacterium]|nr:hypothetical protein [Clostridia bacterium]
MEKDKKVTLEMLREDAERARQEAIEKQALPDGELKDNCLWVLYAAVGELKKRDYGETIIIRITGLRGRPECSVGPLTPNLNPLPTIKDIRKVLKEVYALEEVGDKYTDTQILLRFA